MDLFEDEIIHCDHCNYDFAQLDGRLHPTLDGIRCPRCDGFHLYVDDYEPDSWLRLQEEINDILWSSHHTPEP